MIRAVYILVEGGVCIYSRIYDPALASPMLMSSFISAVSAFSREAMGDELRGIESDGRVVFVADHDRIITVLIAENPGEISTGLIDNIGINFLSRYSKHAELDLCDSTTFREFDGVLDKIIPSRLLESTRVDPLEPLDALSLIEVPQESTQIALLLIRKKSLSAQQAATDSQWMLIAHIIFWNSWSRWERSGEGRQAVQSSTLSSLRDTMDLFTKGHQINHHIPCSSS